jgi:hypothetical protein
MRVCVVIVGATPDNLRIPVERIIWNNEKMCLLYIIIKWLPLPLHYTRGSNNKRSFVAVVVSIRSIILDLQEIYSEVPRVHWISGSFVPVKLLEFIYGYVELRSSVACARVYPKVSGLINTRWEATHSVMAAKLIRLTHKIAIQLHLVAESCTICSSLSRWPVRKLLDTPCNFSYCRYTRHEVDR